MVQEASDRMHRHKTGDSTSSPTSLITFFDFERAYDKVWREGLLHKMIKMKIPYAFVKYVRHFLSARRTKVEVNKVKSNTFYMNEGLPQGSSISPILFLIFINDILDDVDASPSLFADDTAVWIATGKNKEDATRQMQKNITAIEKWAQKWKMSLNKGKTEAMVISTDAADLEWKPRLRLKGQEIKIVKDYKFLGVTLDGGLRFNLHVNRVIAKCKKRIGILKCLRGKDWGQGLEEQRLLYLLYIISALEYAD